MEGDDHCLGPSALIPPCYTSQLSRPGPQSPPETLVLKRQILGGAFLTWRP